MAWYKKIWNGVKKVAKYAAPIAAVAAPFIPGVGSAIGGVISKVGGMFGGSSAKSQDNGGFMGPPDPANPTEGQQVNVSGGGGFNWAKALGDVAPTAIQGALGYLGQRNQNFANAQQAQRQMDFQAEQTGTSYQRGVADMKAAGLNPMLAYSQGGAASGSGAQATMGNELGAGANSAQSAALARQQMAMQGAQIQNINADTTNKETTSANIEADTLLKLAQGTHESGRLSETQQRAASYALDNMLKSATQGFSISSARSAADTAESVAKGTRYGLNEKSAWSDFYGSWAGKKYPFASKAAELSNSAANAIRKFIPFTNQ